MGREALQRRRKLHRQNLTTADDKLVIADDYSEPDGNSVLSFGQAQEKAKPYRLARNAGQYTIAAAMDDYFQFLEGDGRGSQTIRDARYRDKAFVRPKLGDVEVTALTAEKLRHWRDGLVKIAPRLRTRKGEKQKHRTVTSDDALRARRSSANRIWTLLRAALNHAFQNGNAASDIAWRKVKPLRMSTRRGCDI